MERNEQVKQPTEELPDNVKVIESGPMESIPFLTVLVKEEPMEDFENENESVKGHRTAARRQKNIVRPLNVLVKDELTDNFEMNEPEDRSIFFPKVIVKEELLIDNESGSTVDGMFENFAVDNVNSMQIDSVECKDRNKQGVHVKTESKIERNKRLGRKRQAAYKARCKEKLTGNELKEIRDGKALATRLARENETPEQTEARRRRGRDYRRMIRLNETPEQTEARRLEQRQRVKMSRLAETREQADVKRLQARERRKMSRLNETPEQTEARLRRERERRQVSRLTETPEQTEARLRKERDRRKLKRLIEADERTESQPNKKTVQKRRRRTKDQMQADAVKLKTQELLK